MWERGGEGEGEEEGHGSGGGKGSNTGGGLRISKTGEWCMVMPLAASASAMARHLRRRKVRNAAQPRK